MGKMTRAGLVLTVVLAFVLTGCGLFQKAGVLDGTVSYKDGTAAGGAEIQMAGVSVTADSDGKFTLTDIKYDTYDLKVYHLGALVHSQKVKINAPTQRISIEIDALPDADDIAGVVSLPMGDPVEGATVTIGDATTTTNAAGQFSLSNITLGTHAVEIGLKGLTHTVDVSITEDNANNLEIVGYFGYEVLDWEVVGCAYWNSRNTAGLAATVISKENSTATNLCYFVTNSKMFTKEDIPVGSVIEIEEGYNYRPEGWIELEYQEASRPAIVDTPRVIVTEEWWGAYNYRAFNISYLGNKTDVSQVVNEVASKFNIYVPVQ